jgi:threonine dehydrogenase-like Zn-dependent dehydrogenase
LQQIITHRYPIADLQHAFEVFWGGNTGKVIVEHD